MIPVIGPVSAAVLAGLVALHQAQSVEAIIAYAIYATVLRLSIDQLLGPVVLGHAARLHPTIIIFCFISGGLLFGIAGLIMAVPVALSIKGTLGALYHQAAPRWGSLRQARGKKERAGEGATARRRKLRRARMSRERTWIAQPIPCAR